ncbi:MAG: hypothetical protein HOP33_05040 [Verrucomicrobia bacterium]|nr:hypothetical protein [Verrucomicrobiota bacterium]
MKRFTVASVIAVFFAAILSLSASVIDIDLARFTTAKREQTRDLAKDLTNPVPSYVWSFFDAVQVDDWETSTNLAARMQKASGRFPGADENEIQPALRTAVWSPITEVVGAQEQFREWDNKWLRRFGREIIDSIPRGSVFFGGTDPGRFVISALSESHREGKPFFTITQNQLADGTYLAYLQAMYGAKIQLPSAEDSQKVFQAYVADAQARMKAGKLKPGEDVHVVEGRVQVSGQVAVMEINAMLVRIIFDKNPGKQFFLEESFPLDWTYPYLVPHGLVFELKATPQPSLAEKDVAQDQVFWKKLVSEITGDWLGEKTSVKEVCEFTDKIFLRKNLDGFKGDKAFVKNDDAQKCFSKLRSAIGGVYVWRSDRAKDDEERNRMRAATDLAFRQAFALCPTSPEAVFRYVNFLTQTKRMDDAVLIAQASLRLDSENQQLRDLVRQLREKQ